MVGYALGFEMINFLDMWFPDEIHAVIWFFKCKKKKKKFLQQKFNTNMLRNLMTKNNLPIECMDVVCRLEKKNTPVRLYKREWQEHWTGDPPFDLTGIKRLSHISKKKIFNQLNKKWF